MEIFNVGPLELLIILILMFVLLGPKETIRTAGRIGSWVRSVVKSPMWREVMGYSQEIRELPKKIMDETGLKETLDEVRKDTQAATDELNASIKEVTEAARVKEAEHVRIEFNSQDTNTIAPSTAKTVETNAETAAVETAAPEAAVAEETPATAGIAGAIAAAAASAEAKAEEKVKKPRARKKTVEAPQAGEPAVVEVAAQEVAQQEVAAAAQEVAAQEVPAAQEPADAQPAKTRKPRRKKTDEVLPPAPEESAPAAVVPVTVEAMAQQEVAQQEVVAAQEVPAAQQEVAQQEVAAQEVSAAQEVPGTPEAPRRARGRKPKQAETVSLGGAQVYPENPPETANGNGNGNSAGVESTVSAADAPVKRARKPRAPKPAEGTPSNGVPSGNGSGPHADQEENPAAEEQSHRDAA